MKPASLLRPVAPGDAPLSVGLLVLDQTNALSLAASVDPMRAANRRAERRLFDWRFFTPDGQPARITAGFDLPGAALSQARALELLILVASFHFEDQATPALLADLRRISREGAAVIAVDGGGWVLAAAGLLDGHAATTHWEDLDRFAARFPHVQAVRDRFRQSGRFVTTGGASPCIDMWLALIGQGYGPTLAGQVASAFIHDAADAPETPQRPLPLSRMARRAPGIARAIEEITRRLDDPPEVAALARLAGLSRRSFEGRFRRETGQSPHAFGLSLRLAEARRLARDTGLAVQDIALATGFSSHPAFARAFRARFGQSVRDVRLGRPVPPAAPFADPA